MWSVKSNMSRIQYRFKSGHENHINFILYGRSIEYMKTLNLIFFYEHNGSLNVNL